MPSMKCPHCGFEDEGNFCSNCGKPLSSEETSLPSKLDASIKLGFGKSSSANYGYVVELMQRQPTYSVDTDSNIHTATFSPDSIEDFFEVFEYVKNWKSSFVEINGIKFPITKIRNGLSCFRERQKAFDPEKYCFGHDAGDNSIYSTNPLGCRLCGITNAYWKGGWYTIGTLSKSGIFTVDKAQIKHIVKNNIEEIGFCPVLDISAIMARIDELPDKINPKKDNRFEYMTTWEDDKEIATGIRMKDRSSGYVVKDYSEDDWEDYSEDRSENYEIKLKLPEVAAAKEVNTKPGCGGVLVFIIVILIIVALII